jgi:uncharacterized protein YidB (DUF937 family)
MLNEQSQQPAAPPPPGGVHAGLLDHVIGMITQSQGGGLTGLIGRLTAGGLGSAVSSWVGTGPNQPVSPQQVQSALGSEHIEQLAQKFGIPASAVTAQLAHLLPMVINHATPNGQVPANHSLVEEGLAALRGKLLG